MPRSIFLRPLSPHCAAIGPAEAATLILNRRLQITGTVELSFGSCHELSAHASQSRAALLTPGRFIIKTPCPDPHCAFSSFALLAGASRELLVESISTLFCSQILLEKMASESSLARTERGEGVGGRMNSKA